MRAKDKNGVKSVEKNVLERDEVIESPIVRLSLSIHPFTFEVLNSLSLEHKLQC